MLGCDATDDGGAVTLLMQTSHTVILALNIQLGFFFVVFFKCVSYIPHRTGFYRLKLFITAVFFFLNTDTDYLKQRYIIQYINI